MVSRFELKYRYQKYVDVVRESDLIGHNGESVDEPTKRAINRDDFNLDMRDVSVNGSEELLLENDGRRAGIRYMSPVQLAWLSTELTNLLKVNVCKDHQEYWWFTHDFLRAYNQENEIFPIGLVENFELLIRLVMSEPLMGISQKKRKANRILWESKTLASYLAYPTLEGFVKVACRRDIKLNGEIREGRKIRKLTNPGNRVFKGHNDGDGICSNLGMLLWHLETEISRPQHRALYKKMREMTGDIFEHPPEYIYGLLNDYRNDSLHGRNQAPREHGVLLNYISLIAWTTLLS